MIGHHLPAGRVPTPGPWLVRGDADASASPAETMLGVAPATDTGPGGWPYFIHRDVPAEPGNCPLHIAIGIQRLADARLIAAAPDLAAVLLRLLTAPELASADRDPRTAAAITAAWDPLVQVAPHLEIEPRR